MPRHIAIIMDGNGRWARQRGLPRTLGHKAGMASVREVVEGCIEARVPVLTLFAFSQENWQRPPSEIGALMALLQEYIAREAEDLRRQGVRVRMLGELDRLSKPSRRAITTIEEITADGTRLALNICISYSSRAELTRAMRRIADRVRAGTLAPEAINEETISAELYTSQWPDPDLLIRTSGEMRLSNFLLWQLAYAEIHVTPVFWPDFTRKELFAAISDFQGRDRRFGRVGA